MGFLPSPLRPSALPPTSGPQEAQMEGPQLPPLSNHLNPLLPSTLTWVPLPPPPPSLITSFPEQS